MKKLKYMVHQYYIIHYLKEVILKNNIGKTSDPAFISINNILKRK